MNDQIPDDLKAGKLGIAREPLIADYCPSWAVVGNQAGTKNDQMKSKIVIGNDFHQKTTTAVAQVMSHGQHLEVTLTASQMLRVKRTLCGVKDCVCGGIRGPQSFGGRKLVVNIFPSN